MSLDQLRELPVLENEKHEKRFTPVEIAEIVAENSRVLDSRIPSVDKLTLVAYVSGILNGKLMYGSIHRHEKILQPWFVPVSKITAYERLGKLED